MDLQQVVRAYRPWLSSRTSAEIDEEIREELDFHVEMRTRDNRRAGMSPDEARRDAQQRFGDFETSRRACRRITLGPRLMLQRIQPVLLVILICAVVYLGAHVVSMQTANIDRMESLTTTIKQLRIALNAGRDSGTTIPSIHWNLGLLSGSPAARNSAQTDESSPWSAWESSPDTRWCDWGPIEKEAGNP